ncbi:hypothetical protein QPB21_004656 [Vibrio alginolyticus]|uniref:hypothetical protein n=1 Tax=Vibrio TaxID=662 RepID=UPI0011AF59EE|nr:MULTISPECIES: hypothetical protein [Vibrio]EGR0722804.1 hypothetical protein [Vibrio alginolyticus]ELA7328097.1 hypothetical protein [Vibrio alginolyticus]ELB1642127.1 hypothetical protein [Vibrio alginolyticus]MCR9373493.1 hypothetical protein [Vibrio alginolyticus]MCR9408186.1 hypothetical protein [Vibrio alginolyticus]
METIIGTAVGAIIAAGAMLLNSFIIGRREMQRIELSDANRMLEKELDDLSSLYEEVLLVSDRLIRNKGRDSEEKLEKFYNLEVKLKLYSTEEVRSAFKAVRNSISNMVRELPAPPDDFIPKFEDDFEKKMRIEKHRNWETERDNKAKKYLSECWKMHSNLAEFLKDDLSSRKLKSR